MTDPENKALFSIITPARNLETLIGYTMRSLQEQTYRHWECLVVDDASTDGTVEALRALDEPRIKLFFHEERQGVSAARNTALEHASGDYLLFLDGDDLLFSQTLERFYQGFQQHPESDVLYGEIQILQEDGSPMGKAKGSFFHPRPTGHILPALLKRNLITTGATLALRAEAAHRTGGFNPSLAIAEDWEYWCRLAATSTFRYLGGSPVAGYRIRQDSASRSGEHSPDTGLAAVETIFSNPLITGTLTQKRCASLKREAQASVYEYAANHYLRTHRWREGRLLLWKSIRHAGFRPRPWILLIFAILGFQPGWLAKRLK
ncbi:MAG: glycosyltransferase [Candidatus Hydrogenedens sp.]|jgi:cellulose synthase/poly-beta-1,6-N-acetylglucosamine synthase-like glycosyltransferase|nr:glycosyltransferase [Candidatus Hydrogenedens sp.]